MLSSSSSKHADQHIEEATTPRPDPSDPDGGVSEPKSSADNAATAAKLKELKAEARRLRNQMRPSESKRVQIDPTKVATEIVRRPVPEDLDVVCPICDGKVTDKGLSQRTTEIDAEPSSIIQREYLLHKGECDCGALSFLMPGPDRGVEQTIFSPRFVAKLIYNKFFQHLPAYRQAQALATEGLKSSSSLAFGARPAKWQTR